jgi:hypothetical protein
MKDTVSENMQMDGVFFTKTGAQSIRFVQTSAKRSLSGLRIYVLPKNGNAYAKSVRVLVVAPYIPKNRFWNSFNPTWIII